MTFGPGDRLLYFLNHIHRVPNLEWKLQAGGRGCLWRPDTERNRLPLSPRDPNGVTQRGDSYNNGKREGLNVSWDHMLLRRSRHLPTSQAVRLYAEVHGVRTHMVWVCLCVGPGGKKGPGKRNPPILTSCYCWKCDLGARRPHQHRAQCSPGSRGDGMFIRRGTPSHQISLSSPWNPGWCFPNELGGGQRQSHSIMPLILLCHTAS